MKTGVLDSWGILEWIQGKQPAVAKMDALFAAAESGETRLLMSAINVGEVYYFLRKKHSDALAKGWRDAASTLPVKIEVPSMEDIWSAAQLKGQFPISYADAFSAALALKHNCPVVTGDPEFRSISQLELEWIGG